MRDKLNDPARIELMREAVEGLRHVLVHDYYTVNMKTIWNIIQKDLPAFKRHLQSLAFGKSPANP